LAGNPSYAIDTDVRESANKYSALYGLYERAVASNREYGCIRRDIETWCGMTSYFIGTVEVVVCRELLLVSQKLRYRHTSIEWYPARYRDLVRND
jgi:hypothetical protein